MNELPCTALPLQYVPPGFEQEQYYLKSFANKLFTQFMLSINCGTALVPEFGRLHRIPALYVLWMLRPY
jgi:hypothetical protein